MLKVRHVFELYFLGMPEGAIFDGVRGARCGGGFDLLGVSGFWGMGEEGDRALRDCPHLRI
jgi:hypothetical protein